jgi:hypothetical protein
MKASQPHHFFMLELHKNNLAQVLAKIPAPILWPL